MIGLRNHPPWPYIEAVENGLLEALYRAVALYLDTGSSPSKKYNCDLFKSADRYFICTKQV